MTPTVAVWTDLEPEGRSAVIVALIGLIGTWLSVNAGRARKYAKQAADRAAPTGNGFAGRVEDALRDLRADIGGLRAELRDERRETRALDDRITRLEVTHGKAHQEPD